MENKDTILNELKGISEAIASIGKHNPFTVPKGYFNGLPAEILSRIQTENLLSGVKSTLYATPNGYFNGLAENILIKAKASEMQFNEVAAELDAIAPLLNSISKQPCYHLPNGYFKQLGIQPEQKELPNVVSISKWKKIAKYAVAAAFAGVLATAGIRYWGKEKMDSFEEGIAKASDEELKQMLESHTSASYTVINAAVEGQQAESSLFEGTTEEELQQFLKEQPETAEKLNKDI